MYFSIVTLNITIKMQTGNRQPAAAHAGQETSRMRNRQPAAVRAEQETNNLLRYGGRFPAGAVILSRRELKQNIPGSAGLI